MKKYMMLMAIVLCVATGGLLWAQSMLGPGTYTVPAGTTVTVPGAAVSVASLSISPTAVVGGNPATGTVTLSAPAPAGGAVVSLSSNNIAVTVPMTVIVATGATSAPFTVPTAPVTTTVSATVLAMLNGSTTAVLTVNSPPPNVVNLTPGQTYTDLVLPAGTIIQTAGWNCASRVSLADVPNMATLRLTHTATLPTGSTLRGVNVQPASSAFLYNLFDQTGVDNIKFECVVLQANPTLGTRRGIANGSHLTVRNSYLWNFFDPNGDSQAYAGWDTDGQLTFDNNYITAWSENFLLGGSDPSVANRIPSDVTFTNNLVEKPTSWRGTTGRSVKNLFELKNARRVTITGNTFSGNWGDAQDGTAILFTVRNQDGTCPWCTVRDVTFRNNIVQHASGAFNLLPSDDANPSVAGVNWVIDGNTTHDISWTWGGPGRWMLLLTGLPCSGGTCTGKVSGLQITNNIDDSSDSTLNSFMTMSNGPTSGVTVNGNTVHTGLYMFVGDGVTGPPTLPIWLPGVTMTGNTFRGPNALCAAPVPAGNTCAP